MPARKFWLACLAYFGLTIALFWPLVRNLRAGVPHDVGDPLLNTWILWWNARAIPFTQSWWNGPAFWPMRDFLALSEHLVGLSVVATPLQWLGAGPQLVYNILLLLSWPLSAIATYALARQLTGRADAAFIAGLVFGFNPYRLGQTSHVQVLACWWMPLALLALHRTLQARSLSRTAAWLGLFAACWLLQALSNGYFLFYFSVVIGLWIIWFAGPSACWRRGLAIATVWLLAALCTAPILLHYKAVHDAWQLARAYGVLVSFSADVASFATAPTLTWLWPFRPDARLEQALYPGAAAVVLAGAGLIGAVVAKGGASPRVKTLIYALLALAGFMLASTIATWVIGKWVLHVGPVELTGRRTKQPLMIAGLCLLVCGMLDARVRSAVRTRAAWPFYLAVTAVGFAMCLGPEGLLDGERILPAGPYRLLMVVPGVDNLRVPARFMMVALLPFALSAAFGYAWLARRMTKHGALIAASLATGMLAADSAARPLPVLLSPPGYTLPAAVSDAAVLELPLGEFVDDDVAAMVRAMGHGRPVVNGYSGYFPGPYYLLRDALRERDPDVLNGLAGFGPLCLVLDRTRAPTRNLRALIVSAGGKLLGVEGDYSFYRLDQRPSPPPARGVAAPVKQIQAAQSAHRTKWAADGKFDTYWESPERQQGTEAITIELVEEVGVSGVALAQGTRVGEYPRHLIVDTSRDGVIWSAGWQGRTAALAYAAAVRDFGRTRFTMPFTPRAARFVRLRQTANSTGSLWSIAEVEVLR